MFYLLLLIQNITYVFISTIFDNYGKSNDNIVIASIFGDNGMHTRAAVSTNSLPLGVAVEVDAIFELN